jgi:hypothetical protein
MREVRLLMALVAVLGLTGIAGAATINYRILIDGKDVDVVNPGDIDIGVPFVVTVEANVPDSEPWPGIDTGLLQYSVNIADTGDALAATRNWIPFPPPGAFGTSWDSSSVLPLTNYAGAADADGYDVLGQTGAIAPGDFDANAQTFGAATWSEVGSGEFSWTGGLTDMVLTPGDFSSMLIYGVAGAEPPTASNGDTVQFIPEPATMSLLGLGAVALIRRKK